MTFTLVALTGGIGAGKSTVAQLLVERGARLIDADALARAVVDPTTAIGARTLARIGAEFGTDVLRTDGALDRERAAEIVFSDDERRGVFNRIVHPAIVAATVAAIDVERPRDGIVAHEIPLLTAETATLPWSYDLIVTVEAKVDIRIQRMVERRGYTRRHALARIGAQGAEEGRTAIADVVIRTDGTMKDTRGAVDALWGRLTPGADRESVAEPG
jgi:dephospho-CoA kinase